MCLLLLITINQVLSDRTCLLGTLAGNYDDCNDDCDNDDYSNSTDDYHDQHSLCIQKSSTLCLKKTEVLSKYVSKSITNVKLNCAAPFAVQTLNNQYAETVDYVLQVTLFR